MKILWFSPTPSLADEYLKNKQMNGGFIKSLEKIIQDFVIKNPIIENHFRFDNDLNKAITIQFFS